MNPAKARSVARLPTLQLLSGRAVYSSGVERKLMRSHAGKMCG
jgi:hypothetical protein